MPDEAMMRRPAPCTRRAVGASASRRRPEPGALLVRRFPGRIYKLTLDGKVLGVLGQSGKQLKQFGWIHEIACPSENEL